MLGKHTTLVSDNTKPGAPSQCKVDPVTLLCPMQCHPLHPNQNPSAENTIKVPPQQCSHFHNPFGDLVKIRLPLSLCGRTGGCSEAHTAGTHPYSEQKGSP